MQIESLKNFSKLLKKCIGYLTVNFALIMMVAILPVEQQAQAQSSSCWVCSKKPIGYSLSLQPDTSVILTIGQQTIPLAAGELPKYFKGEIKIDPYDDAVSIETNSVGKTAKVEFKLDFASIPPNEARTVTASVSACGVDIPAPGYLQIKLAPPPVNPTGTCTCTDVTTYTRNYYWVGGKIWVDSSEADVGGFGTMEDAQAALDALKAGYDDENKRFNGSAYSSNDGFGYRGTYQVKDVDRNQPSQVFGDNNPPPPGAVFDKPDESSGVTTHTADPYCPVHGTPDPNQQPVVPDIKLSDSMTVEIKMPDSGTGGEKGGSGDGTIGDSGMPIQPSQAPGGDEPPQTLPLIWNWDFGTNAVGHAIGTLTLKSDLTSSNVLGLDKFLTRAGFPGSLTVSNIPGLQAGQTGRRIGPPVFDTGPIQVQIDTLNMQVSPFRQSLINLDAAYQNGEIDYDQYQASAKNLKEAIDPYDAAIAPLQTVINNAVIDAANAIRFDVVKISDAIVQVRRFKGAENTPGIVHQFKLTTVNSMPAVEHTVSIGDNVTKIEINAGTMSNGGRTWSMQDFDGTIRAGSESPWSSGQQVFDESIYRQGGAVFQQRTVTIRANKPWGVEVIEQRIYNSDAPNAVPEISSSAFYENAAQTASYGKLKWRIAGDGSWTAYEYLSTGETRVMRPWKDGPASPQMASPGNSRTTLTSADGLSVTESIMGVVVSTTTTQTLTGVSFPSSLGSAGAGSNTGDTFTRTDHIRRHGTNGSPLISQDYVNERTGRTDWSKDESGNITVWTEALAFLSPGSYETAIRRVRQQLPQAVEEGAPANDPPPMEAEYLNYNYQDRVLKREILAPDGTPASTTGYAYDSTTGEQIQIVQDGVVVWTAASNSLDAAGNAVVLATDAQGIRTRTVTTPAGEVSRAKLGANGTALLTTTTSTNGLRKATTISGGGLTLQSSVLKDAEGRVVQQVDENGVVVNYEYQNGGRTVIEKDGANVARKTTQQLLDGQLLSITGGAVVAEYHDYTVGTDGFITESVHYGSPDGPMYRVGVTNGLGQIVRKVASASNGAENITSYTYDAMGRLRLTERSSVPAKRTLYDAYGRTAVQRILLNNGEASDDDPLVTTAVSYQSQNGTLWEVTTMRQAVIQDPTHDIITISKRQIGGSAQVEVSQSPEGAVLTQTTTANLATATVTTTVSSSQATNIATQITVNGLLQSETSFEATTPTTYGYDDLERQVTMTKPDGAVSKTVYDDAPGFARSRVKEEQIIPTSGGGAIVQASYTYYGTSGQVESVKQEDNSSITYTYDQAGRVVTKSGSASYPLRYEYDSFGRLWKLHTYRDGILGDVATGDLTTWNYDEASGNLLNKTDAGQRKVSYSYDVAGRMLTRTWQRGITTTYSYDAAGRKRGIDYSDSTPDVTNITYDRAGRMSGLSDAAGVHTLTYDTASGQQPAAWSVAGNGPWSGLSVVYGGSNGRRTSRETSLGVIALPRVDYTYVATSGRLGTVAAGGVTATYRYEGGTAWNNGVTYNSGLSSTRAPDGQGRLDSIAWSNGSTTVSSHDYTIDAMNRRTAAQRQDGSAWSYGYNARGEVTSAGKAGEPGKQFAFAYDGIGNRTEATVTSLADNTIQRTTGYTPNQLNQYDSITHPSPAWLVLRGSVNEAAGVDITVNGSPPAQRSGKLWSHEQSVDNSAGPVRREVTISATRPDGGLGGRPVATQEKGSLFIPPPTEVPTYDQDGNQTGDARWNYTWDGENRLIAAEEKPGFSVQPTNNAPVKRTRLEFAYDAQGRRIWKRVLRATGSSSFVLQQSLIHLYDGWNMIAEIDTINNNRLLRSYEWGKDISGTMTGAGGVGGLLMERFHATSSASSNLPSPGTHVPLYDGNGNITELVDFANGSLSARYEYGAFGETISINGGTTAYANPFRFSTRYLDLETGLSNYGYRYYDAINGRWITKDPIEEDGGVNLYAFGPNDAINGFDVLGNRWTEADEKRLHPKSETDRLLEKVEAGKRRTVDWFKSWFSHELQKRMIEHYAYGNGRDFHLTENEMGLIQGDIDLKDSPEFNRLLFSLQDQQFFKLENFSATGFGAEMQGTLGQFSIILNGNLCAEGTVGWRYSGTIKYTDTFNFNPQPWANAIFGDPDGGSSRSISGELKTRYAKKNLPGQGYPVTSDEVLFEQSDKMKSGEWSGKGKSSPWPPSLPQGEMASEK